MKIAVAGSSGLIGAELLRELRERGDEVVALPRRGTARWSLEGIEAVVNLAGASIGGKRWSPEYKKEILDSRVLSTRELVEAMRSAERKPLVLVNASAVGFYGGRGDELLDESAGPGADFLTGVVLSARGGALQQMLPPFKAFVGGPLGSGKQWFPWIHIADEVAAIMRAIDSDLRGPVNLASPGIVTMKEFARGLGKALHRPSWAPVPAAPLKILLGEFALVLLEGQRAVPKKLIDTGFNFRFPNLEAALGDLL